MPHRIIQSLATALFLGEAWFTREGVINSHISHIWSSENSPQNLSCLTFNTNSILPSESVEIVRFVWTPQWRSIMLPWFYRTRHPTFDAVSTSYFAPKFGSSIMMQQHDDDAAAIATRAHFDSTYLGKLIGHCGFWIASKHLRLHILWFHLLGQPVIGCLSNACEYIVRLIITNY